MGLGMSAFRGEADEDQRPSERPLLAKSGRSVRVCNLAQASRLAERDICLFLAHHVVTLQGSIHVNGNECHLMLKRGDV